MIQPIQLNDGKPHHTIQCMVGLFISACLLFLFCHLRLEYQRCHISEYQCSRTSNRSHLETSAEQSDKSILINRLGYTLPQIISKSCERHRRSALCEVQKRLVYSKSSKHNSRTDEYDHYPSRKELGLIHQYLGKDTYYSANHKRFYIIHFVSPFLFSTLLILLAFIILPSIFLLFNFLMLCIAFQNNSVSDPRYARPLVETDGRHKRPCRNK